MFGAVPASLLFDVARSQGVYFQLELDLQTPPFYFIKPEYFSDIPKTLSYYSPDGKKFGSLSHVYHPSFTELREHLERKGFIQTEQWHNGDTVLKPFYLNNYLLIEGDRFLSAPAWKWHSDKKMNYNNGEILEGIKNYRADDDYGII